MDIHFNTLAPLMRPCRNGRDWVVEEAVTVTWGPYSVTTPVGFRTDLASIPQFLRSLIPQNGKHKVPAIIHDYLYRTPGHSLSRTLADKIFLDGMRVAGVQWLRRWIMYMGVRASGWASWQAAP